MIGLRVLHIADSLVAAQAGDVLPMMSWLRANDHQVALAAPGEGSLEGITCIPIQASRPRWWLGGRHELLGRVGAWNPDLIHLHGLGSLPAARTLARRLHLPVVASVAHLADAPRVRGLQDRRVSWVLVPTENHRASAIAAFGLGRDRVSILPYAVDVAACAARPPRPLGGPLVVGMAGPYDEAAGAGDLLAALVALRRDLDVRLVVAGGGPDLAEALSAAGLVEPDWIRDLGEGPAAALIAASDVLVHAPRTDRSAALVVEALACGRPVIASAVGGMAELVADGESGALVAAGDPSALAGAIVALARNPDLRASRSAAARLAAARFDIAVVGPAAVELYHAAICTAQSAGAKNEGSRAYRRRVTDSKIGVR